MTLTSKVILNISEKLQDEEFRKHFFAALVTDEIAEQIRELRKIRELRQSDLAKKSGMKQSAISRIEQEDYAGWTFKTLMRVADALNTRLCINFVPTEDVIKEYEEKENRESSDYELGILKDIKSSVGQQNEQSINTPY